MIELAWLWLRYQPDSSLSVWFRDRVGKLKGRIRRITIVAVARKLLIALWRYLETGLVPTGAVLRLKTLHTGPLNANERNASNPRWMCDRYFTSLKDAATKNGPIPLGALCPRNDARGTLVRTRFRPDIS